MLEWCDKPGRKWKWLSGVAIRHSTGATEPAYFLNPQVGPLEAPDLGAAISHLAYF